MANPIDETFIDLLNNNIGIAHKICRAFFYDTEDREDALQEMIYQMWRSFPHFNGQAKFTTWMYRVCLNTALTHNRKVRKNRAEPISANHYQIPDRPSDTVEEELQMLLNAIHNLSPVNKSIILLYLDDLSYEEIANIVGLSKANVSVRLVRIKKELEIEIKKHINTQKEDAKH